MYYQSWYSGINNSPRLETHSLFKHEFKCESYLDFINDNRFRSALTSFRVSSHQLQIEIFQEMKEFVEIVIQI